MLAILLYNWQRAHGSLKGKTPTEVVSQLAPKTPLQEEICDWYDPTKEHIQDANYFNEMRLRELKGSL